MNKFHLLLTGSVLLCASALMAQHGTSDEAGVRAVIGRFFAAMTARDSVALRGMMEMDGVFHVVEVGPGARPARMVTNADMVDRFARSEAVLLERYWDPVVRMDNGVAMLWCAYDFHVDGTFSHCGHDVFNLVKRPDGWRIASGVFTRQAEGCPPSPLGPVVR